VLRRSSGRGAPLLVVLAASLALPATARGASSPAQELADRYAPIVVLQEQRERCGHGEPFRPVPVDVVLDNPEVVLRGPTVKTAPSVLDLFGKGSDYFLDLPGDPLRPGCKYEEELRRWSAGHPATSYAHVAGEADRPGQIALQYWFYYGFNDFNDKHESDWEMIQLVFRVATARAALGTNPSEVAYSQHSGAERASWTDDKLEKRGVHPVVYVAAGSHANYFSSALWLGRGAEEGFGCDDTRGPSTRLRTEAVLLPQTALSTDDPATWLTFAGRWGQQERGVNNGPTGPATKAQWLQPLRWQEDKARDSSVPVPAARRVGPTVTGFFCGAVALGSSALLFAQTSPWLFLGVVLLVAFLIVWLLRSTRWSPALATPLRRRRAGGQILRTARRVYRRHVGLFLGIGAVFIPLGLVFAGIQWVLFGSWLDPLVDLSGRRSGTAAVLAFAIGGAGIFIAAVLVHSATASAVDELASGARPGVRAAYTTVFAHFRTIVLTFARALAVVVLLALTLVGIPRAIQQIVRWTFLPQTVVLEDRGAADARKESMGLVRGTWWSTFGLVATMNIPVLLTGLLVGVLLLFFVSSLSLTLINVIGALVYALAYPYIGIATTLLYYDRLTRSN
jgi:hypothetical protein